MKKVLLSGWHIALRDKEQGTWERRQCLLLNYNVKIIFQNKSFDSSVTHILHFLTATINTSNNLRRMILHKHHCTGSCRQQPHESASFSSPRDRWQERSLEVRRPAELQVHPVDGAVGTESPHLWAPGLCIYCHRAPQEYPGSEKVSFLRPHSWLLPNLNFTQHLLKEQVQTCTRPRILQRNCDWSP